MRPRHWYCDVWRFHVYYFVQWNVDDFYRVARREYNVTEELRECDGVTYRSTTSSGSLSILIFTRKGTGPSVLAHEALHAANFALDRAGWKPDLENDEPQTYLLTAIIEHSKPKK